jgi:hypothetical protein
MRNTPYYSMRNKTTLVNLDLSTLKTLFMIIYKKFLKKDYFQEYLGFDCGDSGFNEGLHGNDEEINAYLILEIGKDHLWPIHENIEKYTEEDLFDVIEFLYDSISEPICSEGYYHSFNQCGWHHNKFLKDSAQKEYREEVNKILFKYKDMYELSENGHLLHSVQNEYQNLFKKPPTDDRQNIEDRLLIATTRFRSRNLEDRRYAIKQLGDILEYLRPKIKDVLNKNDEKDLFNILNNFGIRHHNTLQKTDYDESIFLSWMFYVFLSSIHAIIHLIKSKYGSV